LEGPAAPKVARAGQALIEAARAGSGFFELPAVDVLLRPKAAGELERLMAENQALRRVANRGVGQTLYRLFTGLEQRFSRKG
jgi:hypothetical protein